PLLSVILEIKMGSKSVPPVANTPYTRINSSKETSPAPSATDKLGASGVEIPTCDAYDRRYGRPILSAIRTVGTLREKVKASRKRIGPRYLWSAFAGVQRFPRPSRKLIGESFTIEAGV